MHAWVASEGLQGAETCLQYVPEMRLCSSYKQCSLRLSQPCSATLSHYKSLSHAHTPSQALSHPHTPRTGSAALSYTQPSQTAEALIHLSCTQPWVSCPQHPSAAHPVLGVICRSLLFSCISEKSGLAMHAAHLLLARSSSHPRAWGLERCSKH